jgi:sigma-E factor negative regulatory protein RseA
MDGISALIDGELDEHQAAGVYARVRTEAEARERWDSYHLIGDAMRGERCLPPRFNEKLRARLAQEPTVLAPRALPDSRRLTRYLLPAAASVAAVALVAWVALSPPAASVGELVEAKPEVTAPARVVVESVPSDGSMNEYLVAHQRFSPSTALQGLAPYVRTVAADRIDRR